MCRLIELQRGHTQKLLCVDLIYIKIKLITVFWTVKRESYIENFKEKVCKYLEDMRSHTQFPYLGKLQKIGGNANE